MAYVSARTMRVRVAFSIVNLVLPPLPAIRPTARDKLSPWSVLTIIYDFFPIVTNQAIT